MQSFTVTLSNGGQSLTLSDSFSDYGLVFSSDGAAHFILLSDNIGEFSIAAKKVLNPVAAVENILNGESNHYVVKPFFLCLSFVDHAISDLNGLPDSNGSVFAKAG